MTGNLIDFPPTGQEAPAPIEAADGEITAKRAKAYADLEPHLCAVLNMGTIASTCSIAPTKGSTTSRCITSRRCWTTSRPATTPWTSNHEATAPMIAPEA
jgi:hypothetical protein